MKTNYLRALLAITGILVLASTGVTQRAQGSGSSVPVSVTFNDSVVTNPGIWSDGRPYVDNQDCVNANVNRDGTFALRTVTRSCSRRLVNMDFSRFVPSNQVTPPNFDVCPISLDACFEAPNLLNQAGILTLNCPSSVNEVPDVLMRAFGLFKNQTAWVIIDINFLKIDGKPDFRSKAFELAYIQPLYVETVSPGTRILTTGPDRSLARLVSWNADGSVAECLGLFELPLEITVTK